MAFKQRISLPFLLLALYLSLLRATFSLSAATDIQQCLRRCKRESEPSQRRRCEQFCHDQYDKKHVGGGDDNPYVFDEEEHFSTSIETPQGRLRVLQRFDWRSKVLEGIRNYRVSILEANPRTFALPSHGDADAVLYVSQGRGTVKLVKRDRLESIDVERGDIIKVDAGTTVYTINRDNNEKLYIVKLFESVSAPGSIQEFFGAGGENPQSFYSAFSRELLEAAFNTRGEKWERVLQSQKKGIIVKASREQIEALSGDSSEGGTWPFGPESKRKNKFNLLRQRPSTGNKYGERKEVDSDDFRRLRDLNVAVSYANITQGSMAGPFYNSRSTKIAVVVEGKGYLEIACPHLSSSGESPRSKREEEEEEEEEGSDWRQQKSPPSYQKVRGDLKPGTVFVVPPGHPFAVVASGRRSEGSRIFRRGQNLEIMCFETNHEGNERYPLAGRGNVLGRLEEEALELAFGTSAKEVKEVFRSQDEEEFFPGPEQRREGGRADA